MIASLDGDEADVAALAVAAVEQLTLAERVTRDVDRYFLRLHRAPNRSRHPGPRTSCLRHARVRHRSAIEALAGALGRRPRGVARQLAAGAACHGAPVGSRPAVSEHGAKKVDARGSADDCVGR